MQLTDVLRGGRQCDEDGVEIIMSRQACHEAADEIERLRGALEKIASCAVSFQFFTISDRVSNNDKIEAGPVMRAFRLHKQIADDALALMGSNVPHDGRP